MRQTLTVAILLWTSLALGQVKFDMATFSQKEKTAEWLYQYDMIAWWTSDSVMAQDKDEIQRLGKEWFCFQDTGNNWHAVYGKYDSGRFDLVFHFMVDSTLKVKRTSEQVDTSILHSYSRALATASKQLEPLKDSITLRFNQFIRQNEDKTFTVWILPAFQPNYTAIYGGEFIYTIDPTGNKVLKDDSYFQGNFKGFKVGEPREIWLNYRDVTEPTLGGIFFVIYYKKHFTKIYIDTKNSLSTLLQEDNVRWIHVEKEEGKKKKKKKK